MDAQQLASRLIPSQTKGLERRQEKQQRRAERHGTRLPLGHEDWPSARSDGTFKSGHFPSPPVVLQSAPPTDGRLNSRTWLFRGSRTRKIKTILTHSDPRTRPSDRQPPQFGSDTARNAANEHGRIQQEYFRGVCVCV